MKQATICVFFLYCSSMQIIAQTDLRFPDIRSVGMGGNGVTESLIFNPARLSLLTGQLIDINSINKYQLKELTSASIQYASSSVALPFCIHVSSFGYDKYRETMFHLSLARKLSLKWVLGVGIQYTLLQTELYEEEVGRVSTDVGILFIPDENLLIGLSITDFPSVRLDNEEIDIDNFMYYSLQTGFQWKFINNMLIAVSGNYNERTDFRLEMGFEYTVYDQFFLRAGLRTNPFIPSMGIGIAFSSVRIDTAINYHTQLGVCTGLGLSYSF